MITLTPKAAEKVQAFAAKQGLSQAMLRVRVSAGGCSGMNYEFEVTDKTADGDKISEQGGAKAVVDSNSDMFINGAVIDYEETLMRTGFKINNPKAKESCSCGTSFSV